MMARRRVITEREVARAAREKRAAIETADAVITPSARDAARKAGIRLDDRARPSSPEQPPEQRAMPRGAAPEPAAPAPAAARIAIGADHGGVEMKTAIASRLRELGHSVTDHGTTGTEAVDYPDFAVAVARAVAKGDADFGIVVDGAGIGSCMAANKIAGIRAAMCYDLTTAGNAREHNDANVLTLGGGLIGRRLALEIVERFLATPFAGGRHAGRVNKIKALDR